MIALKSSRLHGLVAKVKGGRFFGYGFIRADHEGIKKELFFHPNEIRNPTKGNRFFCNQANAFGAKQTRVTTKGPQTTFPKAAAPGSADAMNNPGYLHREKGDSIFGLAIHDNMSVGTGHGKREEKKKHDDSNAQSPASRTPK